MISEARYIEAGQLKVLTFGVHFKKARKRFLGLFSLLLAVRFYFFL